MSPIDICSWDAPGADRYTGSVPAAIAAYGLPLATQHALITAFERREFADSVVIDRHAIRGQAHDYEPDIRAMHFGSRGRVCDQVTRSAWTADHVETALVVCAGAECIAWPAVCGNVFRLTRRPERDPAGERTLVPGGLPAVAGLADSPFELPSEPTGAGGAAPVPFAIERGVGQVGWYVAGGAPYLTGDPAYASCCAVAAPPLPIAAVPEPETWLGLIAGLALIAATRRRS